MLRNKKIRAQQSSWMEIALEDGSNAAVASGVGVVRQR
jgi:hypothetical protein